MNSPKSGGPIWFELPHIPLKLSFGLQDMNNDGMFSFDDEREHVRICLYSICVAYACHLVQNYFFLSLI